MGIGGLAVRDRRDLKLAFGIEVPLEVELRLDVVKAAGLAAARDSTPAEVFTIGTGRPLVRRCGPAGLDELVAWLRAGCPLCVSASR